MTHRFPWSRLAEIAEAPPMPRVPFPTTADVARVRQTLAVVRQMLAGPVPAAAAGGVLRLRAPT